MNDWGDLVARARGLSGHLPGQAELLPLCGMTYEALVAHFIADGTIQGDRTAPRDAHELEWALRNRAAERLHTLSRWAGDRRDALAPLFDNEDLRSLRAIVRAIVAGVPPERRADALIPTITLPARALRMLASSGDVANVASLLVAWGSPFGAGLAIEAARPHPELFRFELALAQAWAERARAAARHDGMMEHFVSRIVDLANLNTVLVLTQHPADADAESLFIEGGRLVLKEDIERALHAGNRELVLAPLQKRVARTPLAAALDPDSERSAEDTALTDLSNEFRLLARSEPTSLAPVIAFVLRQQVVLRTLQRIVWSVSLGVPSVMIRQAIEEAA